MAGLIAAFFGSGAPCEGGSASSTSGPKAPSFTLADLHELYGRLSCFRESDLDKERGGEQVVEMVREITEALVWGEQHDSSFFDFFCEKHILADFIKVLSLNRAPKSVKVQMLQTLSMLVQNIRREQSLFYLLSNHQVNKLILMPLDFTNEEILAYWITLLKSLAMRLDETTINFFFISQPEPAFPLYGETIKFFNHRDQMVRATVRTITLRVYKIDFEPMRDFVQQHAEESYFSQLALHLKGIWLRLNEAAVVSEDLSVVHHENDLQQDLLVYLSDVFELGICKLNKVLAERLLDCAMIPLLVASLDTQSPVGRLHKQIRLAPQVALFLLRQVFELIRSAVLLEPLVVAVFHDQVSDALLDIFASNSLTEGRSHFMKFLRGNDDSRFMFAASIVQCVLRNRQCLSDEVLEAARIFPTTSKRLHQVSDSDLDILWLLLRGLQEPLHWRPEALQVLAFVIHDVFIDELLASHQECRAAALKASKVALAVAASHLQQIIVGQVTGVDDGDVEDVLLDSFIDERELQRRPPRSVAEVCGSASHVLLPPSAKRGSQTAPTADEAKRAVRYFMLLRRLHVDFQERLAETQRSQGGSFEDTSARRVPLRSFSSFGESTTVDTAACSSWPKADVWLSSAPPPEGQEIRLTSDERIVCDVITPGGTHPRYLILNDTLLLLVRTDLAKQGAGHVTTSWPVQQVQGLIDRGDPRILRLALQVGCQSRRPGEATEFCPPVHRPEAPPGQRFFTMALIFEDVQRCHVADVHLQMRRREVRANLLNKVLNFVADHSSTS